jgi:bacterioferritin-associated ferredoxin
MGPRNPLTIHSFFFFLEIAITISEFSHSNDFELHFQNGMIDLSTGCGYRAPSGEPMIVCQCKGVTDRQIRKAVRDGANSRNEVILACTAGADCGGCAPAIKLIIEAENDCAFASSSLTLPEAATG